MLSASGLGAGHASCAGSRRDSIPELRKMHPKSNKPLKSIDRWRCFRIHSTGTKPSQLLPKCFRTRFQHPQKRSLAYENASVAHWSGRRGSNPRLQPWQDMAGIRRGYASPLRRPISRCWKIAPPTPWHARLRRGFLANASYVLPKRLRSASVCDAMVRPQTSKAPPRQTRWTAFILSESFAYRSADAPRWAHCLRDGDNLAPAHTGTEHTRAAGRRSFLQSTSVQRPSRGYSRIRPSACGARIRHVRESGA
jgi:hypothetical protein